MPKKRSILFAACAVVATVASLHATVLTYNITPSPANDSAIPADYGNRAASASQAGSGGTYGYGNFGEGFTSNVAVSYGANINFFNTGYGALTNVVYASDGHFTLTFTADQFFNVRLAGFDLAGFDSSYQINSVVVMAGANTLFTQSNVTIQGSSNGTGMTSFNFQNPFQAQSLTVSFDASNLGANAANVGIDNIRISQVSIPEPSTTALIAFVGGASFLLRRRLFRA